MATTQPPGKNFTVRSVIAGLAIGTVICAANVYFGLQTGWVSIMSMPASLMGFGIFKILQPYLQFPFSPIENVFLQSVACGMAIMPLGCGLVGVVPAMEYILTPEEHGPILLSTRQLIVWSLGLCYFGVVFAVPLRRQVIVRERLRFPSGFSTAVLISVLHGKGRHFSKQEMANASKGGFASLVPHDEFGSVEQGTLDDSNPSSAEVAPAHIKPANWASDIRLLLVCFLMSGLYTILTYFFPVLRNIPILGTVVARTWLWTLNPSFAYIGQGIIMGPETTLHMTLGALVGWAILSPLAKQRGWAPGPVEDWEHGSKGWIVWTSLAIMLVDAVISLSLVAAKAVYGNDFTQLSLAIRRLFSIREPGHSPPTLTQPGEEEYDPLLSETHRCLGNEVLAADIGETEYSEDAVQNDAPDSQRIGTTVVAVGLVVSILASILAIRLVFGGQIPLYATIISVFMALILCVMGVRALGETDLNPVSGISKIAQLFIALIVSHSNPSSLLINLVAGAVSEAGALQAGDLMQDLKTGHLLGAAPKAQFWGQVIGASAGAITSSLIYRLYTRVYQIPGELFQVPTAFVWIFTARLVTGRGLPTMAKEYAIGASLIFTITTPLRAFAVGKSWRPWIPGGIAFAVGMYNVPSFTLARAIGGILSWVWVQRMQRSTTPLIILASGFILGEGFMSIVNLILEGLKVPHL